MAIVDFKPEGVIVSTGDLTRMYTLRETGLYHFVSARADYWFSGTMYVCNLSTDKDTANQKAQKYCEQTGLPFLGDAHFDLEEIRRRAAEDVKAEREAQIAWQVQREKEDQERYEHEVKQGVIIVGKWVGKTPAEADEQYVRWMAREWQDGPKNPFNISARICLDWVEKNPEVISDWIGEVGGKITFIGTLQKKFWTRGHFETLMFSFLTEEGNKVVIFSTAKAMQELEVGGVYAIKGTVKKHEQSYYEPEDNNHVTIVSRPKPL